MRRPMYALLALGLAACGDRSLEPAASAEEAKTPSEEVEAPAAVTPLGPPAGDVEPADEEPIPVSEQPWRWYRRPPDRDTGGLDGGALHDRALLSLVDDPRRYLVSCKAGALVVVRENRSSLDPPVESPAWTRRYEVGATEAPVVGVELGGALIAAAPTERGYVVLVLSADDGTVRWWRRLEREGPGPVQLRFEHDRLIVYVRAPSAAYVHELSIADGALLAARRFAPEVHHAFEPPGRRPLPVGRASPEGYRLVRQGGEGFAVIGPDLRARLSAISPFTDHAAFVEVDGTLVVVTFCGGASGATAAGIDLASGEERWVASPGSIGAIGHSRYANDVRAARQGDLVLVYGDESGGRYVGVIDPAAGALLGYEIWRW